MKKIFCFISLFLFSSFAFSQTITTTGSLSNDRWFHETQLLYNGKVLAFGGDNCNGISPVVYKSAQLYNPATGTWSTTGSMNKLRTDFASVVLPNGNVMAIGGQQATSIDPMSASCEIYNVQTGIWSYTDSMHVARTYHAAISLRNGQVLVVGGIQDNTCELYNPSTNTWSFTSSPSLVGYDGTCLVMLADGRILATLGHDAEIYNPDAGTWTLLASKLIGDRQNHSSVLLNNGNVLITGGSNFDDQTTAELFNNATLSFTATAEMSSNRASSKAILMDNGKVLAYGLGDFTNPSNTKLIEIYDPATATWSITNQVFHTIGSQGYNINKLGNGKILVSGGSYTTLNGASTACFLIDQNLTGCTAPSTSVAVSGQSVCYGNAAVITLNSSENGVQYTLKLAGTGVAQITGTGSAATISLPASAIQAGDNIYTVYAGKTGCASLMLTDTALVKTVITTTKPVITAAGTSVCAGDSLQLLASAGYSTYKWNTNASGGFIYAKNAGTYTVEVTAANGCRSLPSTPFTLTVNPILSTSVSITATKTTIVSGDAVTFTAASTNGGSAPDYLWKINAVTSGSGSTFSTTTLQDGDVVSCVLTSNAVCARPASVISNTITMKVTPFIDHPKVISISPVSNALNISDHASITVTFSKSMSDAVASDTICCIYGSYSGKIKGTYTKNSNSIIFTPQQYYHPGEKISVMIDSAAIDMSGISMSNGYTAEYIVAASPAPATFTDTTNISINRPIQVVSGDLNKDGLIDIISLAANGSYGIYTKLNQGNGIYTAFYNLIPSYAYVANINASDFNNDGYADICVTYLDNNVITIFTNTQQGNFIKKDIIIPIAGNTVSTGDFNGDGMIDIVIDNNYTSTLKTIAIVWNTNNGDFSLSSTKLNITGNSYRTGDFDNDGDLDILVCNGNLSLLKNDGKGNFTNFTIPIPQKQYQSPEIIALGDFDKNGYLDPIIKYPSAFGIIRNTGNGNFSDFDSIGTYSSTIIHFNPAADFDGDGNIDLAFTNFSIGQPDTLDVWRNNGDGSFNLYSRKTLENVFQISSLISADFDNDGDMDIATANLESSTISVLLNGATKVSLSNPIPFTNQLCTSFPVNIPVNKTGMFNTGNIFKIQLSDKTGSFAAPVEIGSANNTTSFITCTIPASVPAGNQYRIRFISTNPAITGKDNGFDLTIHSDCNILKSVTPSANTQNVQASDIVVAAFSQSPELPATGLTVYGSFSGSYLNKGTISNNGNTLTFSPSSYFAGEKITVTIDSTNKSATGATLANPTTTTFIAGSKTASALFTPYKTIDSTSNLSVSLLYAVGDLNNDRKIDIITIDQQTGDMHANFNNGDGSCTDKKTIYTRTSTASGPELFDYDNDGDLDIALLQDANILILTNDGQANFSVTQTISTNCQYLKSGDINNDGFIDLIFTTGNELTIFLNNSNFYFAVSTTIVLFEFTTALSVNDMDNDGDLDIICGTMNNLYIFSNMHIAQTFQKRIVSSGYWSQNLVVSDLNNDKLPDIAGDSKILLNDAGNTFSVSKPLSFGGPLANVKAADFNGDNNMDLFFPSPIENSTLWIALNNGSGDFPVVRKINNIDFALAADVDNDRDIDLVGFMNIIGASSVHCFINDVTFTTQAPSLTTFCAGNTIIAPFIRRGIPDAVPFKIQLSDINGNFTSATVIGTGLNSPVLCTIPASAPLGTGYRIRAVCDSMNLIATDNGIDLTITKDCPAVSSVNPAPNSNTVKPDAIITASFTTDMSAASVSTDNIRVFKGYSGIDSKNGTVTISSPTTASFKSDQNYFAGEQVSVSLTSQLKNTDQAPLSNGYVFNFRVQPESGAGTFFAKENVFGNTPDTYTAIKTADLDNDGDLDIVTQNSIDNTLSVHINENGTFPSKTVYPCGMNPYDICIADIDADGDADIVTSDANAKQTPVFKNDGNAVFSSIVVPGLHLNGYTICNADFNGDGNMDIISIDYYTLYCNINDGTGNFTKTTTPLSLGSNVYSYCCASGDIDSDGDVDVIVSAYTYGQGSSVSGILATYTNDGYGNFTHKDLMNTANANTFIYTADFNNDGKIDFATYDGTNTVTLGINTSGTFTLQSVQTEQTAYRLDIGDIDGDGDIDLIVPTINPLGLTTLKNNGSASFISSQFIAINPQPDHAIPADIDNDGDLDIIMTGAANLRLLLNAEPSIESQPIAHTTFCGSTKMDVPFTTYGLPDNNTYSVELSDATGSFATPVSIGTGTTSPITCTVPMSVSAGNAYRIRIVCNSLSIISNDNGTDITIIQDCPIIASVNPDFNSHNISTLNGIDIHYATSMLPSTINTESVRIFSSYTGFDSNKGTVSLSTPSTVSFQTDQKFFPNEKISVSLTNQIETSNNVNVMTPFTYEFTTRPITSSGNFALRNSTRKASDNFSLVSQTGRISKTADLDNDGNLDIVTTDFYTDQLSVYLNNKQQFASSIELSCGTVPQAMSLADIDADGDLDILTATKAVTVFKNNGSAVFAPAENILLSDVPEGLATADFDGDGNIDIAAFTFATGLSVNINNGTGSFTEKTFSFLTDGHAFDLKALDIDMDGDMDIVGTTFSPFHILTFENDGHANFSLSNTIGTFNGAIELQTADFNNDGKMDFITFEGYNGGGFDIGFNQSTGFSMQHIDFPYNSYCSDVADVDGDGDIDIISSDGGAYTTAVNILKNDGSGNFTLSQSVQLFVSVTSITPNDIDNDGDVDIVTNSIDPMGLVILYNGAAPVEKQDPQDPPPPATAVINATSSNIRIYPNPASDYVIIESADAIDQVIVYNMLGNEVMRSETSRINVDALSPGIYTIKVISDKGSAIQKICIE